MINFVVVEDNAKYRKTVVEIILAYMMKNKYEFKIHEFDDYNSELVNYISCNNSNNIYILDFELPSGSAIDISRKVRETDWRSPIIVLTAYTSFALDSFKKRLQLLDFLSKKGNVEKNIHELFDLCIKMLFIHSSYKYTYHNIDHNIPFKNILYIIRDGRRVAIVTDENTYYQNISIISIKKSLNSDFMYSSKGVLLNMKRIKSLDWNSLNVTFDNGINKSLLSKSHRKEIENYECI